MLREWTDVLLLHLIKDPRTIERLSGKLEPRDISDITMDAHRGFLWKCSRDYFAQSKQTIPQHFLISALTDRAIKDGMNMDEVEAMDALIQDIYSIDSKGLNTEIALEHAKRMLEEVRVNRPVQEMLQDGSSVAQIFDTFQVGLSAAAVSMAEPINPMAGWEGMLGTVKPVPLGGADVSYFNKLVNGGLMPGEIVVLMGPMGGYKTTVALDLCCSIAKVEQKHTAFMSYEQSWRGGDLSTRFMSRLSGIDRDLLMNTSIENLSDEHKATMAAATKFGEFAMFFDRSQKVDKVSDMAAMVRELVSIGKKPELMVIDQLMTWMQMWPESSSSGDESWFRKESTKVVKSLKSQICEEFGTRILLLHQITAGSITGKKGKTFAHTESAENKGLGFWADFVITLGTKDDKDVFKAIAGKTRRGPAADCLVQALPKICRFRDVTEEYQESDTGGYEKKGQRTMISSGTIPTSKMQGSKTSI